MEDNQIDDVVETTSALDIVLTAYESSKRNQGTYFNLFRDMYRLWRFYKEKDSVVKVFSPAGYATTVGLLSKLFVKTPSVSTSVKPDRDPNAEKLVKALLEYQFDNPTAEEPMDEEYISFLTEMFVCGTAVAKVCWDTQYVVQYEEQPQIDEFGQIMVDELGQLITKRVKVPKKAYDDPIFEHIPIENFYFQPGAKNIATSRYCIYEKWVDLDYLREKEALGIYKNIDGIVAGANKKDTTGIAQARTTKSKGSTSEAYKDKVHILEYVEDDRILVVANSQTVIRDEDNPDNHGKKPFVMMTYTKVPHEFYGIGALEPIQDLQKVKNISLTQRLEYVASLLTQQFGVLTGRNVDEDAVIEGYPVVHMSSADAVFPLQKGTVPQASFVMSSEIDAEIEKITGFSGYSGGTPASAQDKTQGTATGTSIIVQEAQTRFDLTLKRFEKNVLRKTAILFLELDRQYLPETEEKLISISTRNGREYQSIAKEVLNNLEFEVDIVPGSVGYIDKQQKFTNFEKWINMAVSVPGFNALDAIMESADYLEVDNPERFFMSPEMTGMPPQKAINPQQAPQEMM